MVQTAFEYSEKYSTPVLLRPTTRVDHAYQSMEIPPLPKAREIEGNPNVCLSFPWYCLERQIHIQGTASKISSLEVMKYFLSRPKDSQIGAWVSHQSSVISARSVLEAKFFELKQKFAKGEVPVPSFWGGFRVKPRTIEFWQGGKNRLHDRLLYTDNNDGTWKIERLAP